MSMHKKPLTPLEEEGLRKHGLAIGTPSQLSDVFLHGVAWALSQQAAQPVAPVGWLYDWTHSSATGRPDERFTSFTADEVYAFKGMGHENVRPVYAAAQPQQATEGSRLSDLRGLLADAQPKQPNGQA